MVNRPTAQPFVLLQPTSPEPAAPPYLITLPLAPADDLPEDSDLDALASLEAHAYDRHHSLGRPYLRQLCLVPRKLATAQLLTPRGLATVPALRLALVARPYVGRSAAGHLLLCPPAGLAWLEIFADPPAEYGSPTTAPLGAVQITRLTLTAAQADGRPLWPAVLRALMVAAAEPPPEFMPPEWTPHSGRRPLAYFAPWTPQPIDLSPELAALGFTTDNEACADAFGPGRHGRLFIHRNAAAPGQGLTVTTTPRPEDPRP